MDLFKAPSGPGGYLWNFGGKLEGSHSEASQPEPDGMTQDPEERKGWRSPESNSKLTIERELGTLVIGFGSCVMGCGMTGASRVWQNLPV